MNAAVIVAITEEHFKKYLVICEYLKIDPTVVNDIEVVKARCQQLMANVTLDEKAQKRLDKDLKWFIKNYNDFTGNRWYSDNFVKKCKQLIKRDNLRINPETVTDKLETYALTQSNYAYYYQKQKKSSLIALGVILGILLLAALITGIVLAV